MRQWRGRIDQVSDVCSMIAGEMRRVGRARFVALIGLVSACMAVLMSAAPAAVACGNEAARTGLSANLPDCRAYEQVTPASKSSAVQDMGTGNTTAIPAVNGERLALSTQVTFGSTPQLGGSFSVFTHTTSGWKLTSVKPVDSSSTVYEPQIFSPDLTQVGVRAETAYPPSPDLTFQVGVPGGPFATVAATPRNDRSTHNQKGDRLLGANTGTTSVPALSHVVFGSIDHTLLSAEHTGTNEKAYDLYEWVDGRLQLVNVTGEGSQAKVIGKCGAVLGTGELFSPDFVLAFEPAHDAVSADGSKVFFTVPDITGGEGEDCYEPRGGETAPAPNAPRLYMRVTETVEGHEESRTVEVSGPEGVKLEPIEEEMPVYYQAATADGSKVFFVTERALTPEAVREDAHLYEYDTEAPEGERLTLIFQGDKATEQKQPRATSVFPSEDGSVVYFYRNNLTTLYRYEEDMGPSQLIASLINPIGDEAPYSTPDGEFFLFVSPGVAGEPRGAGYGEPLGSGHNELYRYDHADGSVMCVSCGPGYVPPNTNATEGTSPGIPGFLADFETPDQTPEHIIMSADGSEVFFDSTAALVPQVVDEGIVNVYEWEADGAGTCTQSLGCTYLISQGNSQTNSELIGASLDGSNVFFMTHAQLVPQDTDTSNDIYDARVDGGFPAPAQSAACLGDTCLSQPVTPNDPTPASSSFSGPENSTPAVVAPKSKAKPKGCAKNRVRRKGKCVKQRKARKAARRTVKHSRGGSR
jgi:hypothetical protein